jgi:hypothetical protein
MIDALQLRDNARYELEQIRDLESGIDYLNKVKAIETWAKAEKKDAELQNMIAEQKIRTQRILGQLLKDSEVSKNVGNRFVDGESLQPSKTLQSYGITKDQSSTFQKIAALPDEIFEHEISVAKQESEKRIELTTSRVLNAAKEYESQKKKDDAIGTPRDRELIQQLKNGETVVVNQRTDLHTIKWAEDNGYYVRCDRFSEWGNPFEMGKDGDRDDVCNNYNEHYFPFKPSLLSKIKTLKGKALGCWCAPERCHCDTLKMFADEG